MKILKNSDNENEEILEFHTENNQCDINSKIKEIRPETLVSNYNSDFVDKLKKSASCKKNIKLKKHLGKYIIDEKISFELNDYICELDLKRRELSWDISHTFM